MSPDDLSRLNMIHETRKELALESTGKSTLPPAIAEGLPATTIKPLLWQPQPDNAQNDAKVNSPNPANHGNSQTIYTFHSAHHQSRDFE